MPGVTFELYLPIMMINTRTYQHQLHSLVRRISVRILVVVEVEISEHLVMVGRQENARLLAEAKKET